MAPLLRTLLMIGLTVGVKAYAGGDAAEHQFAVYAPMGVQVYLSDAQTIGGFGGGVGLRDTVHDRFVLQADASYLPLLGNTFSLRLGAGLQRPGTYSPALLATLTVLFGDRLTFLTLQHPASVGLPATALGIEVAPLRFTWERTQLSLLQLGVGLGSDFPGLGVSYHLGLAEVAIPL